MTPTEALARDLRAKRRTIDGDLYVPLGDALLAIEQAAEAADRKTYPRRFPGPSDEPHPVDRLPDPSAAADPAMSTDFPGQPFGRGDTFTVGPYIDAAPADAVNLGALHKLATILHQRESAGAARCGPQSRGCRMRHRMDATSILTEVVAALPQSAALDVERLERALFKVRFNPLVDSSMEWAERIAAAYLAAATKEGSE